LPAGGINAGGGVGGALGGELGAGAGAGAADLDARCLDKISNNFHLSASLR